MRMGENPEKMDKVTIFSITERKRTFRYFFSMSDKESYSVRKRMWKITSDVFIVLFLRIAPKRRYNKKLINLVLLVITGKPQTLTLMY